MAKFIITGGGGFVGRNLGARLISRRDTVISLARSEYPELASLGIEHKRADISNPNDKFLEIFSGADGVFHVAAKVDMWGSYQDFYNINVLGTENIIKACKKAGVKNLVFTSSPSVIADGSDLCAVNETYPYPQKYKAFYPETKAKAEQLVRATGKARDLNTVALRPHLIFGAGDTNLIPTILSRARAGKLMQVGSGKNLVDFSYIEDCVSAHILAMDALLAGKQISGNVYFVSQGEPTLLWHWINEVLERSNLAKISKKIPAGLARIAAGILENICNLLPNKPEPRFTKFLVSEMSTSHYFDISAACRDLGYEPKFRMREAMERTFEGRILAAKS